MNGEGETVRVELAERAYDIVIGPGLLAETGRRIADALGWGTRLGVVTDENVARHHLDALRSSLESAGLDHAVVVLPPGEGTKSWAPLQRTVAAMLDARLERGDAVLAMGGGVIGDLAGFAAAITRRGMRFVQLPTSLLAQVDSSVGGKTGINAEAGKNLVGAFHQPSLVIADTETLDTLSARERRAGYAEVVKYGLIDRPDFFEWLERHWRDVTEGGPGRAHAIAESCRAKADVVARDERESGDRALLNLGHTFGHALERAVGYDGERLVHGEGVAIGMAMAHRFSRALDLCPGQDVQRVVSHLRAVGLPTRVSDIPGEKPDLDTLFDAIGQDKKVSRGALTFILTRGIGRSYIASDVPPEAVRAHLERELSEA